MAIDDDTNKKWERFLSPDHLRKTLAQVGIFLCAYEMLKTQTIKRLKDFYSDGFDSNGPRIGDDYKVQVLAKARSIFIASQLWLLESEAINQDDLKLFEILRNARNLIAHELPEVLSDSGKYDVLIHIKTASHLIHKIENWWFVNVEMSVNPEFDNIDVDFIDTDKVVSGTSIMLDMLEHVALADPEVAYQYLEAWKTNKSKRK